ncbi:MAG: hypothetical protein WA175_01055 [Candidatus Acidiferrales bacterium]
MRTNPAFELFEEICAELGGQEEAVLIDDGFSPATLQSVKRWFKEPATTTAVTKALDYLRRHFEKRGSVLPFEYDLNTGRVTAVSREFIDFVADAQDKRTGPKESRAFEVAISDQMAKKLTGILRRVGWPRKRHKTGRQFAAYLIEEFGFRKGVLVGRDKDGGFDLLWFPPLGAFPFRAVVSIQCKNSLYDRRAGFESVGRAKQTLRRHSHASSEEGHLHCVIYNDYIDEGVMDNARDAGFVPLGLSDLAPLVSPITLDQL